MTSGRAHRMHVAAHQRATFALGGAVSVVDVRNPSDGSISHAVQYVERGTRWLSSGRFPDIERADAAAEVLSNFLGARLEVR